MHGIFVSGENKKLSKRLNTYGIRIRKYVDFSLGSLLEDIEKLGKTWGGFYIQREWGGGTREEATEKILNENITNN